MAVKKRKVFSLSNFRGLDTENKPLKIASFRASDGENFIIDSDVLKTRPSFTHVKSEFHPEIDDYIIDWYNFRGVELYLTKEELYIKDGLNYITRANAKVLYSGASVLDFSNTQPFFREEKECLFIFNVKGVFVFSTIKNAENDIVRYAFYDLGSSVSNPYPIGSYLFNLINDLPKPYEPTIFIGGKGFEDMNLLSGSAKYKLFVSKKEIKDGMISYKLPSVYSESEHMGYTYNVSFYKDLFKEVGIYPIFLGTEGEDFTEMPSFHGTVIDTNPTTKIQDVFFPAKDFEYRVGTPITAINEIVGMKKEWFFNADINGENVFSFLLEYIKQNLTNTIVDSVFKFAVPMKYTSVLYDAQDLILSKKVVEKDIFIFVKLKYFESDTTTFNFEGTTNGAISSTITPLLAFPVGHTPFSLNQGNAIVMNSLNSAIFAEQSKALLLRTKGTLINNELVAVRGIHKTEKNNITEEQININNLSSWVFARKNFVTNITELFSNVIKEYTLTNPFPAYPTTPQTPTKTIAFPITSGILANFTTAFNALITSHWLLNGESYADNDIVLYKGQFFEAGSEAQIQTQNILGFAQWVFNTIFRLNSVFNIHKSLEEEVIDFSLPYPAYPTNGTLNHTIINITVIPHSYTGNINVVFENMCKAYIENNQQLFTNNQLLEFRGQLYKTSTLNLPLVVTPEVSTNWLITQRFGILGSTLLQNKITTTNLTSPYPSFPTVGSPYDVITPKNLTPTPLNFDGVHFEDLCEQEVLKSSYLDGDKVVFDGHFFSTGHEVTVQSATSVVRSVSNNFQIVYNSSTSFPLYSNSNVTFIPANLIIMNGLYEGSLSATDFNIDTIDLENIKAQVLNDFIRLHISRTDIPQATTLSVLVRVQAQRNFVEVGAWGSFDITYDKGGLTVPTITLRSRRLTGEVQKGNFDKPITLNVENTFPLYPTITNPGQLQIVDLGIIHTGSLNYNSVNVSNALTLAIENNINSFLHVSATAFVRFRIQDNISLKGLSLAAKVTYQKQGSHSSRIRTSIILLGVAEEIIREQATFPLHPTINNPHALPVLDLGVIQAGNIANFNYTNLITPIESALALQIPNLIEMLGDGFAKVRFEKTWATGIQRTSAIIGFSYTKATTSAFENRQSFIRQIKVSKRIHEKAITLNTPADFPVSPTNNLDLGIVFTETNTVFNYNDSALHNNIINAIRAKLGGLAGNSGTGVAGVKIQNSTTNTGVSLSVGFTYQKHVVTLVTQYQSFLYTATVNKITPLASEGVYSFTYDKEAKMFVFKVKDYFFDYNHEPNIEIKITFAKNPDYQKISESKFGIVFGSENRLFLAGNEKYPHIDRFNVSNDLLGLGDKNQSYELTYFPSKNLRVLGGKGAINGYVVATDSHLYITKEEASNDEKLFIRERLLNENGIVGYKEYKTSVQKTPLNNRCIVRFNNDIVMLTDSGVYAIELTGNVLTDERLIRLRSGFINKVLVTALNNVNKKDIFILENNNYMYIFIGKDVFVADSRYIDINKNAKINNLSYEFVKWKTKLSYKCGKIKESGMVLLNDTGKERYELKENSFDDEALFIHNFLSQKSLGFLLPENYHYITEDPQAYIFKVKEGYKLIGTKNTDYDITNGEVVIRDEITFRSIGDGTHVYFKNSAVVGGLTTFVSYEVRGFDTTREKFFIGAPITGVDYSTIYINISDKELRIKEVVANNGSRLLRLVTEHPEEVITMTPFEAQNIPKDLYVFPFNDLSQDCFVNKTTPILTRWVSIMTDFGNKLMEKTMFRANLYISKKEQKGLIKIGHKTMRRYNQEEKSIKATTSPDLDMLNFSGFTLNTFSEFGSSIPLKENNFLYIQFIILGEGQIELSSLDIIYKINRSIKSIS